MCIAPIHSQPSSHHGCLLTVLLVITVIFYLLAIVWFLFEWTEWSMVVVAIAIVCRTMITLWDFNELFRPRKALDQQNCNVYVMLIDTSFDFCVRKFWQILAGIKKKLTYVCYNTETKRLIKYTRNTVKNIRLWRLTASVCCVKYLIKSFTWYVDTVVTESWNVKRVLPQMLLECSAQKPTKSMSTL